jgi:hypothetical protein
MEGLLVKRAGGGFLDQVVEEGLFGDAWGQPVCRVSVSVRRVVKADMRGLEPQDRVFGGSFAAF